MPIAEQAAPSHTAFLKWSMKACAEVLAAQSALRSSHVRGPDRTDPDKYKVVFENDHARALEYLDRPGDRTTLHVHPDSVMYMLSRFSRRLYGADGETRDVDIVAGTTG